MTVGIIGRSGAQRKCRLALNSIAERYSGDRKAPIRWRYRSDKPSRRFLVLTRGSVSPITFWELCSPHGFRSWPAIQQDHSQKVLESRESLLLAF